MDRKPSTHRIPCFNRQVQTFENFDVTSANRVAVACGLAVAEAPFRAYNPLFIQGDSGQGKSHLLRAIESEAHSLYAGLQVERISLRGMRLEAIAEYFGHCERPDYLIIDEFERFADADVSDLCGIVGVILSDYARGKVAQVVVASQLSHDKYDWCTQRALDAPLGQQVSVSDYIDWQAVF